MKGGGLRVKGLEFGFRVKGQGSIIKVYGL